MAEAEPPRLLILDFAFGSPVGSDLTDYRSRVTLEFDGPDGKVKLIDLFVGR